MHSFLLSASVSVEFNTYIKVSIVESRLHSSEYSVLCQGPCKMDQILQGREHATVSAVTHDHICKKYHVMMDMIKLTAVCVKRCSVLFQRYKRFFHNEHFRIFALKCKLTCSVLLTLEQGLTKAATQASFTLPGRGYLYNLRINIMKVCHCRQQVRLE